MYPCVCVSVSELLLHRWTHHPHLGWICCTNTRDGSYLFFGGHRPPWGAPPPMGKAKIAEFLSPTRCKGGGHSFCPIHTKFSALNILNAQNCWVNFQKLGLKTSLRHEPSNFNRSWEKSDILSSYLYFWVLNYFFRVPHTLRHPRGFLLPLGTPALNFMGVFDP